jgi:hypothetical protein
MLLVEPEWPDLYGEKLLLASIVRRAAYDIAQYRGSKRLEHRRLWKDAYDWMFREREEQNFEGPEDEFVSFHNVCSVLGINPRFIREVTLGMGPQDVKRYQMIDPKHSWT